MVKRFKKKSLKKEQRLAIYVALAAGISQLITNLCQLFKLIFN